MMKARRVEELGRVGHGIGPHHAMLRDRQFDVLPGPETQRLLDVEFEDTDVPRHRRDAAHVALDRLDYDGTAQQFLVVVQKIDGQVAVDMGTA